VNILEINNLNVSYGSKQVIKNLSMNIEKNKITAVIGPSGCGKSTLLTTLNLMIAENGGSFTGEILFKGKDILSYEIDYLRRMIGIVFQKPTPFPFSIYKNLTYAPKYYGIKDKNRLNEIVENILKRVGLYDEINKNLNMLATKLSGGQQQRLCIGRALTVEPEILLLDEPCSALDRKNTANIEEMLLELSKDYTIVVVTIIYPKLNEFQIIQLLYLMGN